MNRLTRNRLQGAGQENCQSGSLGMTEWAGSGSLGVSRGVSSSLSGGDGAAASALHCDGASPSPYSSASGSQFFVTVPLPTFSAYLKYKRDAKRWFYSFQQGQYCDICSSANSNKAHPITNAIDGTERWWQSPPLSRGLEFNQVNVTLDLGQVSQVLLGYAVDLAGKHLLFCF